LYHNSIMSEDYSFMRSGFDPIHNIVDEDDNSKNTISLIVAYAEGAMRTSSKYILHGERRVVTPEDLKRGMMLEMFLFKHRDNILDDAENIKNELFGDEVDDGDQDEMDDIICDEAEEFKENTCECSLCTAINTIYSKWEEWEPVTSFEKIFQTHINNMN
jgi:hypothetical protein